MNNEILDLKGNAAVQAHINMMQGMISRMANNSANCKVWCITILSALFALYCDKKFIHIEFCYFITGLFCFLDCFYLGLERSFIKEQNRYVDLINQNEEDTVAKQTFFPYPVTKRNEKGNDCFVENFFKKMKSQLSGTIQALFSFSTFPFYGMIMIAIYYLI